LETAEKRDFAIKENKRQGIGGFLSETGAFIAFNMKK